MKIRFYRWYNGLLASLLAFLGYGCSSEEPNGRDDDMLMYGMPTTEYQVKGSVTDEKGKAIPGIQVKCQDTFYEPNIFNRDSVKTDANGKYNLTFDIVEATLKHTRLVVQDVDGAENGEFENDTINLNGAEAKKIKDGEGWFNGAYEVNVDVKLKKK